MPKLTAYLFKTLATVVFITSFSTAGSNPFKSISASSDTVAAAEPARQDTTDEHDPLEDVVGRDTTAIDTIGRMRSPSLVGTLDRNLPRTMFISNEDMRWIGYTYLGEILETHPGIFLREQASAGQYTQPNFRGIDGRSIAFTSNGRLLNDPASGIFNLFDFSPEYADRIEIITGPRAFLYGMNSSGGAVNVLTKNYNSNRPFSKLNYGETAYDYQYSDGTFSQNVSRKLNVTFGFQHQGTGGRFTNMVFDSWQMRGKLRYNLSPDFNIIFSEYYTATDRGLNGGIDYQKSGSVRSFNRIQATVVNPDAYEKISRHDLDLSIVGTMFGDTTNVSLVTFYYSSFFREYRDEENRSTPNGTLISSDHTSSWMGALFRQNFDTDFQRFNLGANVELRQIEGSPNLGRRRNVIANIWAQEELLISSNLMVAGFARSDQYINESNVGAGADITFRIREGLSVFGGASVSRRMPNYTELFWTDSTLSRPVPIKSEGHRILEAGIELKHNSSFNGRVALFTRTVDDPILMETTTESFPFPEVTIFNGARTTTRGIEGKINFRVWKLFVEGNATHLVQKRNSDFALEDFPQLSANGGIFFWEKVLNDKLEIKIGFRGRYQSSSRGMLYNPEIQVYVPNQVTDLPAGSSVDFFFTGKIGDAYIYFMWDNVTNVPYFLTPFYPVKERSTRLGLSWQFLN